MSQQNKPFHTFGVTFMLMQNCFQGFCVLKLLGILQEIFNFVNLDSKLLKNKKVGQENFESALVHQTAGGKGGMQQKTNHPNEKRKTKQNE